MAYTPLQKNKCFTVTDCPTCAPPSGDNTALIVGLVVGIFVAAVVIGAVIIAYKRHVTR